MDSVRPSRNGPGEPVAERPVRNRAVTLRRLASLFLTTWFAAGLAACATGSVPAFSVQPPVTPGSQGLPITSVGGIAARAAFSEPALATRIAWHPSFAASAAASSEDTRPAVVSLLEQRQSLLIMQSWDYSCGAASLATLLNFQHGDPVTEREIALGLMARPEYVANPIIVNIRKGFSLADLLEGFPGVEKLRLGHGPIAEQGICEQDTITVPTAKNDEMAGAVDHDRHHRRSPRYELVERHLANPSAAIAARIDIELEVGDQARPAGARLDNSRLDEWRPAARR